MDWKLELIVVPVEDIDRAKAFYVERAGWDLLVDFAPSATFRVVQVSPPGSACAIALMRSDAPGSLQGLHLMVTDIEAARSDLVGRGVEVSAVIHFVDGVRSDGPDPERRDYNTFCAFADPDGNGWLLQERRGP